MRFTLLAALGWQSVALRPELSRASVSQKVARVGGLLSKTWSPSESLVALKEAAGIVDGILADGPNDHISDDDAQLLRQVVDLVEKSIYASMDSSHAADEAELAAAVGAAASCNENIAGRQAPDGDLGGLHQKVQDKQTELNRLQGVVDEKTEVNNTKWAEFESHMQHMSDAPACPDFPARTMPTLDVYFEKSEYSIWFTAQQTKYNEVRYAFTAADSALEDAIRAYDVQKAVRDTQYCDWKAELEAACAAFDTCFNDASKHYTDVVVPRVTADMNSRIEVKKAGDTLVHQINFLLGEVDDQQTPDPDTSRYELTFPDLPAKGLCDLGPLDSDEWVPQPECIKTARLMDGCLGAAHVTFSGWGVPREESAEARAGEATCCTAQGRAVRHFNANGQPVWDPNDIFAQCPTPTGERVFEGDSPSWTFFEARAICEKAGLRLCSTQKELESSCDTGCAFNAVMVWVE